jgi:hypothetical protein
MRQLQPTIERALSQRPPNDRSALGPLSRPRRDLLVLVAVAVGLVALVRAWSQVEHPVPVSLGNNTIENADEVLADAEARLQELADSQGGRVAEEAACYFYRPLGSTQGGMPTEMLSGLLSGAEDAEASDMLLCGPAELAASGLPEGLEGLPQEPWVPGLVNYFAGDSPTSYRGEVYMVLPTPMPMLTAGGGVSPEVLLDADGRAPDGDTIDDPTWREIEPSGDPVESPLPPGILLPEMPDLPDMPDLEVPTP